MRNFTWILAFLALTFVGDRVGGFALKKITENSQFRYSRIYNGTAESDILLVGNSRGLMFYQPYIEEITGESTLNISYNGMPMNLAKVFIEDYYEKYSAPKLMILDITMCDRSNPKLISGFNTYTPFSENLQELIYDVEPKSAIAGKVSHLYRYNGEVFQRAMYYLNRSDEDWLLDRVITDELVADIKDREPYTIDIQEDIMMDLKGVVDLAKSKGTVVQLVINPYYPPFADKITNLDALKNTVEQVTGLPVYNYARSVANVEGFGDYQHLNKNGSRAYLDKLVADKLLPLKDKLGIN
jgi:hypothetical protein